MPGGVLGPDEHEHQVDGPGRPIAGKSIAAACASEQYNHQAPGFPMSLVSACGNRDTRRRIPVTHHLLALGACSPMRPAASRTRARRRGGRSTWLLEEKSCLCRAPRGRDRSGPARRNLAAARAAPAGSSLNAEAKPEKLTGIVIRASTRCPDCACVHAHPWNDSCSDGRPRQMAIAARVPKGEARWPPSLLGTPTSCFHERQSPARVQELEPSV
jgi:hypothetical protein